MNNYIWLAVYVIVGAYLLKEKDEFLYGFVPKRVYIGMWALWVFGLTCIIIGVVWGLK